MSSKEEPEIRRMIHLASQALSIGDYDEALILARKLQSLDQTYMLSGVVSGILIDTGSGTGAVNLIEEGIQILKKDFEALSKQSNSDSILRYNLANAYLALHDLEAAKNPKIVFFNNTQINDAISEYKRALANDCPDKKVIAEVFVNLGNCYKRLGRVVDAIESYDQALKLQPDFGMALGNKGRALLMYASVCGDHQRTYVLDAYGLLASALKQDIEPVAADSFSYWMKIIENKFPDLPLKSKPEFPGYKIKAESDFERFMVEFNLTNRLYLNVCFFCKQCNAAIGDTAVIKTMIVPAGDISFLKLSEYLNQIKQDYVLARFLLVLSRYDGLNLDFVDKRVTIIDTASSSAHNIYVQLLKGAFKTFYDILDKIAVFINDYLKIGLSDRNVDFSKIWYADKVKTIRPQIAATDNLSLNALYEIHKDLDNGDSIALRKTRNALTHRFVNVRTKLDHEDDENMTETTLVNRTLELAVLVRSSILYLLHFVNISEMRNQMNTQQGPKPIIKIAKEIPDQLKNSRKK